MKALAIALLWSALLIAWQDAAFPDCHYDWTKIGIEVQR